MLCVPKYALVTPAECAGRVSQLEAHDEQACIGWGEDPLCPEFDDRDNTSS